MESPNALGFLRHHNQRQPSPGQHTLDAPPEPHGLIEQLQRHLVYLAAAKYAAEEPPCRGAYLVELIQTLDREAVRGEQRSKLLLAEAALVTQRAVKAPDFRPLRHEHDQRSTWLDETGTIRDDVRGIGDVFQDIDAQHRSKRSSDGWVIGRLFRIEFQNLDIRSPQKTVLKSVQVQRISLRSDIPDAPAHEAAREVSYTGAHFEHGVADMRPQFPRQPTQVLRRAGHVVEEGPAVGLRVQIVDQPEVQDDAERADAIAPTDLLPFLIGTAVIADGNLVNPQLSLGRLHRDLGLEAETVAADRNALEEVGAKHLVAGLHVGEVQVAEHVGDHGQPLVDHGVPIRQHSRLLTRQVARAENGIGAPVEQGPQELRVFRGIVFEIGVLHQAEISVRIFERGANGRALAFVHRFLDQTDLGVF